MNLVITGTSSGIGQALARRFVEEGHDVWGLARRPQQAGGRFRTSVCDVSDWPAVERAAKEVAAQWTHVDGLVCCAGTQGAIGAAMNLSPEDWAATVRANLEGALFTVRAFFGALSRCPRRAKVVCFSGGGAASPRPNFSAYGVAKAGIVRLVETLAAEWRELPVDINAVAPGAISTAMTEQILRAGAGAAGEKELAAARKQLAAGGQPMDKVVALVAFLLSLQSDGLSGKFISAQWDDWKTFPARRQELMKSDVYTLRRITEDKKP
ncbi:MAG TPA: SDR family oxidoreductase [Verrucomicrobiae bacterium]|nr:SDR family oxidoreductase [Verrucomicrobiae bacterium]